MYTSLCTGFLWYKNNNLKPNNMHNTQKSLSIFKYLILTFVVTFVVTILINNL